MVNTQTSKTTLTVVCKSEIWPEWYFSKKYESLDYDTNYNSILVDEMRHKGYKFVFQQVHIININHFQP